MLFNRLALALTVLVCLGAGVSAQNSGSAQPSATSAPSAVTRLADGFIAAITDRFPEVAGYYGLPGAKHDAIFDNSPEAYRAWNGRVDALNTEFRKLDRSALAGRDLVVYGFLAQALDSEVQRRVCRTELWGVDHLNGWHVNIPAYLERQPIATDADKKAALDRLRQYAGYIRKEIDQLRAGLAAGYSAPKGNVDRVDAQIDGLLAGDAAKSPFIAFADKSTDADFKRQAAEIVATQINPAVTRYKSFLGEYRGVARDRVGVAANTDGAACYRALIKDNTSLDLGADEVHQIGVDMMASIQQEVSAIGTRAFQTSDAPAIFARMRTDPALKFKTADEIMTAARTALDRARAALPRAFGKLPKQEFVLEPFAPFEAPSMPAGMYRPGTLDGRTPGKYMVNTYKPEEQPRYDLESVAFHEAVPGHHLQVALAYEQDRPHVIQQLFGSTAFIEGWGLYSERLADELGLYSDDLSRLGMLSNQAWRAARLVVDTGLHAKGWSRQQAIDYMSRNTATSQHNAETEVDRYIIMPGQALAYMIGFREITAQRAKAQQALGTRFDLREFHDIVNSRGAVTLPILREQVDAWIASKR